MKKRGGNIIDLDDNTTCAHNISADRWGVCLDIDTLKKIASAYNKKHKGKDQINLYLSKPELIKEIKRRFQQSCDNHDGLCWVNHLSDALGKDQTKEIKNKNFKPERPKGKKDWLSTYDIADVMNQFEKKYDDFAFFGPFPVDFMEILDEFPFQNLKQLQKNKIYRIGMIFNLDRHDEPGSHWVAYFLDLKSKKPSIEYFDSVGKKPPQEIEKFMDNIIRNAFMNLNHCLDRRINKVQHQKKNTECGVYSLYFITERLKGRTFDDICKKVIDDDTMNAFRAYYFRPYEGGAKNE